MSGPLYPNQQLRSVSLETFFAGRLSALSRLEQVQEEFREYLPNLFVPNAIPNQAPTLQPFQLRSEMPGQGTCLAIALNQVSFVVHTYPGYERFVEEGLRLIRRTHEILGVTELLRVAYRYENLMAVERRDDDALSIDKILNSLVPTGCSTVGGVVALNTTWKALWSRGFVEVLARVDEADGLDALRLGIGAFVVPAGPAHQLAEFAALAHQQGRECFESLITNDFRKVLEGDNDEAGE